jgi:predicted XRE-type DNA-binding protein
LVQWFNASGLTQAAAAKTLGVTQPRLNQLLKGKIDIFSLDALVNMATSAGMRVDLIIRPQKSVKVRSAAPAKHTQPSKQGLRAAG